MRPLARLEEGLEGLAERPVARILRLRPPVEEVARRLERTIVARPRDPGGVPAAWEIALEPGSPLLAEAARAGHERWLAEELRRRLRARGIALAGAPSVRLAADPSVARTTLRIRPAGDPAFPVDARSVADALGAEPAVLGERTEPWDAATPAEPLPPADRPIAALEIRLPGRRAVVVPVRSPGATLGRGRDCELRLPDAAVSRRHGVLLLRQGLLVYRDEGSRNGSRLNGVPVREAALGPGDLLELGGTRIALRELPLGR